MTDTTNLGMTLVEANVLQPSVPINAALNQLDAAVAGTLSVEFTSDANLTLTEAQYQQSVLIFTDSPVTLTAGRDVIFPAQFPRVTVVNSTTQTLTCKKSGQTGIAIAAGQSATLIPGATDVLAGSGTIDNDAVTNAKLANMAASTIKARKTASTGDPEDCTLSEVLDLVGSAATGDILYRAGGGWTRLAVGTNGHVLTLAAGVPSWAAGGGGGGALTNWTDGISTSAPNATVPVVSFTATNAATNVDAVLAPKGTGGVAAHIADSAATGGNKRGASAVDWQTVRSAAAQAATGSQAVIGGGANNTASFANSTVGGGISNTAGAAYATVPGGNGNTASGQYSIAAGRSNTASGAQSAAFGHTNTVAGTSAAAFGQNNTANGTTSFVTGSFGNARSINSARVHSATTGRQSTEVPLYRNTTDATATVLTSDGGAAAATNQYALSSGMASCLRIMVIARQTAGSGTVGDCKAWVADALLKNIGGTTSLVAAVSPTAVAADAGAAAWSIAITADNALDVLKVEVTGEASKTIQWTAVVLGVDA